MSLLEAYECFVELLEASADAGGAYDDALRSPTAVAPISGVFCYPVEPGDLSGFGQGFPDDPLRAGKRSRWTAPGPRPERARGGAHRVLGAEILADVGARLAVTLDRASIARQVRAAIDRAIPNDRVRLFLGGDGGAPLRDEATGDELPAPLTAMLRQAQAVAASDPPELYEAPEQHEGVRDALAAVGAEVALPLRMRGGVVGAITVGRKRSGLFYTAGDLEFLRALAHGAAIALQNGASYEALRVLNEQLEDRVRERTRQLAGSNAELERANAELTRAYADLKAAQVQLVHSEKLASLGRLAAGVAHEINNPVSFVVSNIEPLRERLDELTAVVPDDTSGVLAEARAFVDIMGRGAERTARIVEDLRTFSRLNAAPHKAVDLREAIDVTLRLLESRWHGRIEVHRQYGTLPAITCDAGQLNQVFMNLLANACDAIDGRGNIWIRSWREGETAVFEIRDDGHGIEPEVLGRVFEPFFTTKDVGAGVGLGLATVHGIVTAHHGRVEVDSVPGRGAAFRIVLPIDAAGASTALGRPG